MDSYCITGDSLKLFSEAVSLYLEKLTPYLSSNNQKISEEHDLVSYLPSRYNKELRSRQEDGRLDWMNLPFEFGDKELPLLKAVLTLLKEKTMQQIEQLKEKGAPDEAAEGYRKKIEHIEKFLLWEPIATARERKLLAGILVPKIVKSIDGGTIINATIHNQAGIVAVGHHINIQQKFSELDGALQELCSAIATLHISMDEKQKAEAYIGTVQLQLTNKQPDRSMVQAAWHGLKTSLQTIDTADGVWGMITRVAAILATHHLL